MSAKLTEIFTRLKQNNQNGSLTVVPTVLSEGNTIANFYQTVTVNQTFIVDNATVSLADDQKKVTVTGKSSSFSLPNLNAELIFTEDFETLASTLILGTNDSRWQLEGVSWFSIDKAKIILLVSDDLSPIVGAVEGNIEIGVDIVNLQVRVAFPIVENKWIFRGEFEEPYPSISHFYKLLGGEDLSTYLPSPINTVADLGLREIQIVYNSQRQVVPYIYCLIKTKKPWLVIPELDLSIMSLELGCTIENPGSSSNRRILFSITGYLSISNINLVVTAYQPELNQDDWQLAVFLPSNQQISLRQIATKFFETFVSVPLEIPDINFPELSFTITSKTKVLTFYAQSSYVWKILDKDELSIKNFTLNFIRDPQNFKNTISGYLEGNINIAGIDLFIAADLNHDSNNGWQFQGSAGKGQEIPIGILIQYLAKLFGDITLPTAINELTIENLGVLFNTKTYEFTFTCEGKFSINDKATDTIVTIEIKPDKGSYSKNFYLTIGTLNFELHFERNTSSNIFIGTYNHSGEQQKINIKELVKHVSSDLASPLPENLEIDLKDVLFAYRKDSTSSKFLFGLDISADINLSHLPLVGTQFPPDQTVGVDDLQLLFASKLFDKTDLDAFTPLIPEGVTPLPQLKNPDSTSTGTQQSSIKAGLNVAAHIKFGNTTQTLALPVSGTSPPNPDPNQPSPPPSPNTSVSDNTKWFTLQKTFGPVHFERVGIQYQDAALWFLLDAALSAAGLTLSLDGLSVGSPLSKFDPKFNLKGIGIDYRGSSAVEIGGAFLKVGDNEYDGTAIIKTEKLTISAIGSYAELNGHPSLFIYATLDQPIGGPAFFFVTGLAAGFGYNRTLKLPPIEQVAQFPLVAEAINPQNPNITGLTSPPTPLLPGEGSQTPSFPASIGAQGGLDQPDIITQKLQTLKQYIPPATGEIFLAVGIKFTSFKMVDSFALLTLAFGNRFELNLLGISTLIAPTPEAGKVVTPLAEVQLALKATFIPADGILQVQAQLTPASYLFSRNCHLTGGFAFYTWFGNNTHTGDFVLTLGGYHPNYQVPAHYPQVPRLGFNWQVDDHLSLKGDAYYALTPSALMAGGHLEATWKSGNLKAWFNAGADFLIAWKPYHYEAHIYVDLGASYTFELFGTHTITVDVGADLQIWGPEFSGKAQIHCSIFSVEVSFGNPTSQQPQPIDWNTFKASFLPHEKVEDEKAIPDEKVLGCSISVKDGLVRTVTQDKSEIWIINPKHFSLITNSVIPSKKANLGSESQPPSERQALNIGEAKTNFGIISMALESDKLASTHTITITNTKDGQPVKKDEFDYIPIYKDVPTGLWKDISPELKENVPPKSWDQILKPDLNQDGFIKQTLSGFEIRPKNQPEGGHTQAIDRSKLQYETESLKDAYKWLNFQPFTAETLDDNARRDKIQTSIEQNPARNNLLTALGFDNQEIEKIKLNPELAKKFLVAPQVGALAD